MITATLVMDRYDTGDDNEIRGQFAIGDDVWSWGQYDNGEFFWMECLEGEKEGHYFSTPSPAKNDVRYLVLEIQSIYGINITDYIVAPDNGPQRKFMI